MPRQAHKDVENRGSTARDHLANERTFLAWVRTGLGVVGLGLLLEKMIGDSRTPGLNEMMAGLLLAAGVLLILYGLARYLRVQQALRDGRFMIARLGPIWIGCAATALVVILALWRFRIY